MKGLLVTGSKKKKKKVLEHIPSPEKGSASTGHGTLLYKLNI